MSHTTDNRFQIICSYCGLLSSTTKLFDAIRTATRAKERHSSPEETIEIFDLLAHTGRPELYTHTGKPITYKEVKAT